MATDMFLKIDKIKGESKDDKHKDEIDIQSFSFGMSNHGTWASGGGGGAGKVSFEDISFTKYADLATAPLMQACANGDHIATAVLTVRKAGGKQEEYYKMSFKGLMVSSVHNTGMDGGVPTESVSLNFSQVKLEYKEQKDDGTLGGQGQFGWDLKANKKL